MAESREAAILRDDNNVVGTALANESEMRDRNRKLLAANIKLKARAERAEAALHDVIGWGKSHNAQGLIGLAEFGLQSDERNADA